MLEKLEKYDENPIHAAGTYSFWNNVEKNDAYPYPLSHWLKTLNLVYEFII